MAEQAAMQVTMRVTELFFDRDAIIQSIGRARARTMSRQGAFLRTRARTMLRRRKRVSAPGSPPSIHSRSPVESLKNIRFFYDPRTETVVVGSVALNGYAGRRIPNVMEFGGRHGIEEQQNRSGKWVPRFTRRTFTHRRGVKQRIPIRSRLANYKPRPYMGPALKKEVEAGTIPEAWSDAVRS